LARQLVEELGAEVRELLLAALSDDYLDQMVSFPSSQYPNLQ
jgi:hypothetical protein